MTRFILFTFCDRAFFPTRARVFLPTSLQPFMGGVVFRVYGFGVGCFEGSGLRVQGPCHDVVSI